MTYIQVHLRAALCQMPYEFREISRFPETGIENIQLLKLSLCHKQILLAIVPKDDVNDPLIMGNIHRWIRVSLTHPKNI